MSDLYEPIRRLLGRVRTRWRAVSALRASCRGAFVASAIIAIALALIRVASATARTPLVVVAIAAIGAALAIVAIAWTLLPLRRVPSNASIARYIEERVPSLDDRLATAVDVFESNRHSASNLLAEPLVADAARRAEGVDLDDIVPATRLRAAGLGAGGAVLVLLVLLIAAREPARQSLDAASLALFPERVKLAVAPGDARVKAGTPFTIDARLVGNRAPVLADVQLRNGGDWRHNPMSTVAAGAFRLTMPSVSSDFTYRVVAGSVASPLYTVTVARPPRVTQIDVEYTYPPSLALRARTERDSGDIYAPAGTDVRLLVHTDRPAARARMVLGKGEPVALSGAPRSTVLTADVKVVADNSYRVALADADGLSGDGDTEYFIRILEDRPPEVHVIKPAADRQVTPLEEVEIEAQADDDYGIDRMELVYAVRGGEEHVVRLDVPRATSVTGRHTLYLEDVKVQPGDFISYYVRARDVTRGSHTNEARSDIFFLEVKPFEQEFALAQSQSMAGSGYNGSIDDLVNAQKQVVVATWKLDRRRVAQSGAQSTDDVRAIGRTEAELKSRVEATASSFRESTMRDPRRRLQPGGPSAGDTMPEEDAMTLAATAMAKAVASLNAVKTSAALPPEMEALNALLRAQAEVKRRQVSRQQSASGGPGNNNRNYDISTLFDKELQRTQQTNYETRSSTEQQQDPNASALEKIRELARRQDELLRRQQGLAERHTSEEELKRQLEKLTRAQSELRQQAEELARQISAEQNEGSRGGRSSAGNSEATRQIQEALEEMRNATSELRRRDPAQASARSGKALDRLRALERQMQAGPGAMSDRRRAAGDMQLESRQLADSQRQLAAQLLKGTDKDTLRRLAGEQDRLADRARQLRDRLRRIGTADANGARSNEERDAQRAAAAAARDAEELRVEERMRKSAEALRGQAGGASDSRIQASDQQAVARDLDKLAEKLTASDARDPQSRKAADQLARAQALRQQIERLSDDLHKLGQKANGAAASSSQKSPGETGKTGEGQRRGAGGVADAAKLRDDYARQLQQTRELLDELRRQDPSFARGGGGFTFEGQGMTLGAPGTEAFKQDFAKWDELARQATQALDRAESALSQRLQEQQAHDRLAAGVDDRVPPQYRRQVDSYFRALAAKRP